MSISIARLSEQLQNALDTNYNVINMSAVLQVITTLEGIHITREQLETTRLGKYINHLRRKTENESLARRSKNLLRKWRNMILPVVPASNSSNHSGSQSNDRINSTISIDNSSLTYTDSDYTVKANGLKSFTNSSPNSRPPVHMLNATLSSNYSNNSNCSYTDASGKLSSSKPVVGNFTNLLRHTETYDSELNALPKAGPYVSGSSSRMTVDQITDDSTQFSKTPMKKNVNSQKDNLDKTNQTQSRKKIQSQYASLIDDEDSSHQYNLDEHVKTSNHASDKKVLTKPEAILFIDDDSFSSSQACASSSYSTIGVSDTLKTNQLAESKKKNKKHKKEKKKKKSSKGDNNKQTPNIDVLQNNPSVLANLGKIPNSRKVTCTSTGVSTSSEINSPNLIGKLIKNSDTIINIDSSSSSNSPNYDLYSDNSTQKTISLTSQDYKRTAYDNDTNILNAKTLSKNPFQNTENTTQVISSTEPKKRGRKRGSKGIDGRMLDNSIVSSSLLMSTTSQNYDTESLLSLKNKIDSMRGATKKVKTTKELLAELQNRKIPSGTEIHETHTQPSSPASKKGFSAASFEVNHQTSLVPSPSTLSDNSEHSHPNSAGISTVKSSNVHIKIENDENALVRPTSGKMQHSTKDEMESSGNLVESEIVSLRSQLNPINSSELMHWHEETLANATVCTCTVKEVENVVNQDNNQDVCGNTIESVNIDENVPKKLTEITQVHVPTTVVTTVSLSSPPVSNKKKAMKSIFDLDYEEDNDPIHSFKLNNNIAKHVSESLETENNGCIVDVSLPLPPIICKDELSGDICIPNKFESHERIDPSCTDIKPLETVETPLTTELSVIPTFMIEEDPNCQAKEAYVTKKTAITKYHIEHLHNFCIPNINGNWDQISSNKCNDNVKIDPLGLYERVVPLCNHITMDSIPKNLKDINLNINEHREAEQKDKFEKNIYRYGQVLDNNLMNMFELNDIRSTSSHRSLELYSSDRNYLMDNKNPKNLREDLSYASLGHARLQTNISNSNREAPNLNEENMDMDSTIVGNFKSCYKTDDAAANSIHGIYRFDGNVAGSNESGGSTIKINDENSRNHFVTINNFDTCNESSTDDDDSDHIANDNDSNIDDGRDTIMADDNDYSNSVNNVILYCNPVIEETKSQSNSNSINDIKNDKDVTFESFSNKLDYKKSNLAQFDGKNDATSPDTISQKKLLLERSSKRARSISLSSDSSTNSSSWSDSSIKANRKKFRNNWENSCVSNCKKKSEISSTSADSKYYNKDQKSDQTISTDVTNLVPLTAPSNDDSRPANQNCSTEEKPESTEVLPLENNGQLPSFNNVTSENESGVMTDGNKFKEWYEVVRMKSYNDELLTILPYVVID